MAEDTPGTTTTTAGAVRRWGIDEARKTLYDLVDAAAAGRPALIGRGTKCAVLSPLSHLDPTWQAQLSTWPATPVTTARRKLGDLLAAAASGTPQLLLHRRTPIAALLPATAEALPPSRASATRPATITPPDANAAARRLTALDDALDEVLTPGTSGHPHTASFGLHALDTALGGLQPGTLTLIAAAPGAGGSLVAAAAARHTALTRQLPVLYAASGLTRTDIAARIIAAETPVDYRRLRTGALTTTEEQAAATTRARLAGAPLHMDDGTDLTADAIAHTAPDITGLTLVVVDRLQHTHDPQIPLSGPELPAATRVLAHLARTRNIPVLAVLDTDLPNVVAALDPDLTLTLTRTGEHARIDISERDFGTQATTQLRAELPYARFTDPTDSTPAPGSPQATPPSPTSHQPPRPVRKAATTPPPRPKNTHPTPAGTARDATPTTSPPQADEPAPGTPPAPGRRRADRAPGSTSSLATFVADRVEHALREHGGDVAAASQALAGDGGSAIPDVMELFEATRVASTYQHTTYPKLPEPLVRKRRDAADDVWEARPKFTHPDVPHGTETTELDVNAAYLAALQSAHLPVRTITHNPDGFDDLANYGKGIDLAGICRIDPITWNHPHLPHPLGDDRETTGTLWIPTSVLLSLRDFASPSYGELCTQPVIREAYVAKGTTTLFKGLVRVLDDARLRAITDNDTLTKTYVAAMYAKLVSTMGDSRNNHQLRRPEWQHIIRGHAFSNLRRKAIRAHQAGLTVVHAGGTDELHLTGDVWHATTGGKHLFTEGRALNQIKVKKTSIRGRT